MNFVVQPLLETLLDHFPDNAMGKRRSFDPLSVMHREQLRTGIGLNGGDPWYRKAFEDYRAEKVRGNPERGLRSDVVTEHGKFQPSTRQTPLQRRPR